MADLLTICRDLLAWSEQTGGWEAPVWERLAAAVAAADGAPVSVADGPYRPALAEAFRDGAAFKLQRVDPGDLNFAVPDGALVEEAEGGATVHCVVFVSDGERPLMPGEDAPGCATCAASIETRCFPCDECGAVDEEDGEEDEDDSCTACGRESLDCSRNPCPAVIADREA